LYQLKEGPTNESFGIHVARLAGLPQSVIDRAWQVLESLEAGKPPSQNATPPADSAQLSFFSPAPAPEIKTVVRTEYVAHPAMDRLRGLHIDELTPLQALNLLAELKTELKTKPRAEAPAP
jgi:DNA mismatch repair protein MutS